jgi:hypothetical protein
VEPPERSPFRHMLYGENAMYTAQCEPGRLASILTAMSVSSARNQGSMMVTIGHHELLGSTVIVQTCASIDAAIVTEHAITALIEVHERPVGRVF